jgi:septum formation protein
VDVDESRIENEKPEGHVLRLAQAKAWTAAQYCESDMLVLGADTVVVHNGDILGKPKSRDEAG